jgi:hypothetical protein
MSLIVLDGRATSPLLYLENFTRISCSWKHPFHRKARSIYEYMVLSFRIGLLKIVRYYIYYDIVQCFRK